MHVCVPINPGIRPHCSCSQYFLNAYKIEMVILCVVDGDKRPGLLSFYWKREDGQGLQDAREAGVN